MHIILLIFENFMQIFLTIHLNQTVTLRECGRQMFALKNS